MVNKQQVQKENDKCSQMVTGCLMIHIYQSFPQLPTALKERKFNPARMHAVLPSSAILSNSFENKCFTTNFFLLCNISCAASWGYLKQKPCAHQADKRLHRKGCWLLGRMEERSRQSALAPLSISYPPPHLYGSQISLRLGTGTIYIFFCLFVFECMSKP